MHASRGARPGARDGSGGRTIGGFVGRALTLRSEQLAPAPHWALPVAAIVAVATVALVVPTSAGDGSTRATLRLKKVPGQSERRVTATVRLRTADAADGARWLTTTSWQCKAPSVVPPMRPTGAPGEYRTTEPCHPGP